MKKSNHSIVVPTMAPERTRRCSAVIGCGSVVETVPVAPEALNWTPGMMLPTLFLAVQLPVRAMEPCPMPW